MKLFSIVLVTVVVAVALVQAQLNIEIDGNHYFISTPLKKNWFQSFRQCYLKGMYLVDMESPDENAKISQYLRVHRDELGSTNFWTSGTASGSEGDFYWAITGNPIAYNGFTQGKPDNNGGIENCLEFAEGYNYDWNDNKCHVLSPFICRATRYTNLKPQLSPPPKY